MDGTALQQVSSDLKGDMGEAGLVLYPLLGVILADILRENLCYQVYQLSGLVTQAEYKEICCEDFSKM